MNQYFHEMLPLNSSGTEMGGFLDILDEHFYVQIKIIEGPPRKIRLKGTWKLHHLLKPVEKALEQHLEQCTTFLDILEELKNTLEQQLRAQQMKKLPSAPTAGYYNDLLQQLEDCGWDKVRCVDTELSKLQLNAIDSCDREHCLHITIPSEFPNASPTYQLDIPGEFTYSWTSNSTLKDLYEKFESCLASYGLFWDCMDEIDNHTWVLEPEKPNRSDCKRRIVLAPTTSLLIIVNPAAPTAVPVCNFLGPERVVEPLRKKLNSNIRRWDENDSLLFNLKSLLEIDFPSPSSTAKEDFCVECGICYAYQLENEFPDILCGDENCSQPFHHTCLYEWLKTLSTTRHSFNTVFGECPYCSKPISCALL